MHTASLGSVKPAQAGEARILVRRPTALWRELRPGRDTKLDQHIGPNREVAWTEVRLKRIEHAAPEGATVNDVVLAVVAGDFATGSEVGGIAEDLRIQCPVCVDTPARSPRQLGNRDSFMNVDLPIAEEDAADTCE